MGLWDRKMDLDGWIKNKIIDFFPGGLKERLNIELYKEEDEFGFVAKMFGLGISVVILIIIILQNSGYGDPRMLVKNLEGIWDYFWGAIEEEAAYRFMPLVIAMNRWSVSWKTLVVCLASSLLFGLIHATGQDLLVQGFVGVTLSLIFIQIAGPKRQYLKAYSVVVGLHILLNFFAGKGFLLMIK